MRERECGRIVLIGSITADLTGQGDAAYAATKAAVAHLGRQFAREWVRQGINVNTVQPGYIRTEIDGGWFEGAGGRMQIASFHRLRLTPIETLDGRCCSSLTTPRATSPEQRLRSMTASRSSGRGRPAARGSAPAAIAVARRRPGDTTSRAARPRRLAR